MEMIGIIRISGGMKPQGHPVVILCSYPKYSCPDKAAIYVAPYSTPLSAREIHVVEFLLQYNPLQKLA